MYFKGKPIWVLNYYGYVLDSGDAKPLYAFLHKALALRHPTLPVRGAPMEDGNFRYEIRFKRTHIGNFIGVEQIYDSGVLAYECYVHGGFVT